MYCFYKDSKNCKVCAAMEVNHYTPTTEEVFLAYWRGTAFKSVDKVREREAFDRWLQSIKAKIWYEGFDAGEQDVWEHHHGEAMGGAGWDSECIKNPYEEEK